MIHWPKYWILQVGGKGLLLLLFFSIVFISEKVMAEEDESGCIPPLAEVFPMRKEADRVVAAEDILINPRFILKSGMKLRAVYIAPDVRDPDVRKMQRKKEMNDTYARTMWKPADTGPTPKQQAALDRVMNTIWNEPAQFQAAFARLQRTQSKLVLEGNGTGVGQIQLEPIELMEGILVARENGALRVLCIEEGSKAERAGLKASQELTALNGQPLSGDLALLQKLYLEAKSKGGRLEFTARTQAGETRTATITMPRSLNSDLWSEIDTASPSKLSPHPSHLSETPQPPQSSASPVEGNPQKNETEMP